MKYRNEIDGLRAIAVLPVILFHAGFSVFSGGFVGVDIFFVISGYLITGIIIREMSEGEFSLLTFYERRARRILPALTTLVLACLPVGWVMMMPDPMENFGQSVVATMLSANNILLTITNGYWDLASEFKPLLHTWSLAVEEQFYIVFPLILMAGWALLNERTIYIVVAITIASFLAAVLLNDRYPTSSFYLLHTRAWELGIGAVGAFITQHRDFRNNDLLAGTGLILIAYSVFFFDGSTPFPSSYTLVPVVGAFLTLLFARSDGWVGKLLSIGALQWVGLISYSLYLWHQPIFAFARVYSFEEPSWIAYLALIALCFVLAYLSWRYVEKPFRVKGKISTKAVFASAAVTTATLSVVGLLFHFNQGYPQRVFEHDGEFFSGMHISYNERVRSYYGHSFEEGTDKTKVLMVGNSQARDFSNMLFEAGFLGDDDLVYRDDLEVCAYPALGAVDQELVERANVIFLVIDKLSDACKTMIASDAIERFNLIFVGPKHFGYNLNAFVRLEPEQRPLAVARIFDSVIKNNIENARSIPEARYIDLIAIASLDGVTIRIFDQEGNILSADREHVTKAGAVFFASRLLHDPSLDILR